MKHPNIIAAAILGASIVLATAIHGCTAPRYDLQQTSNGVIVFDKRTGVTYVIGEGAGSITKEGKHTILKAK